MVKEKEAFLSKENIPPCLGIKDAKILCSSFSHYHLYHINCCPVLFHRERINSSDDESTDQTDPPKKRTSSVTRATLQSPPTLPQFSELQSAHKNALTIQNGSSNMKCGVLLRSDSISASKCVGVIGKYCD